MARTPKVLRPGRNGAKIGKGLFTDGVAPGASSCCRERLQGEQGRPGLVFLAQERRRAQACSRHPQRDPGPSRPGEFSPGRKLCEILRILCGLLIGGTGERFSAGLPRSFPIRTSLSLGSTRLSCEETRPLEEKLPARIPPWHPGHCLRHRQSARSRRRLESKAKSVPVRASDQALPAAFNSGTRLRLTEKNELLKLLVELAGN